jgi:hypothetical protein
LPLFSQIKKTGKTTNCERLAADIFHRLCLASPFSAREREQQDIAVVAIQVINQSLRGATRTRTPKSVELELLWLTR